MRRLILCSAVCCAVTSCSGADHPDAPVDSPPVTTESGDTSNMVRTLVLDTYDGSGQTVHPDFASVPAWGATRGNLLALTPYPSGISSYENPAVYLSADRVHWAVPVPSLNPIVGAEQGYLSDPDLVYDPDRDELLMYFRRVNDENEILLMRTRDVSVWSAPVRVAHAPNHEIISPSVVRRGAHDWLMWSINGHGGCAGTETSMELRRSEDGVAWSAPESVTLSQTGFWPWHVEVQWIPSRAEFWAVYNAKTAESCNTPALFFATSKDAVTWTTFPSPILERGDVAVFGDIVYRATFSYDPSVGTVTFWYSGATYDGRSFVWRSATERLSLARVFALAERPTSHRTRAVRRPAPQLTDPP